MTEMNDEERAKIARELVIPGGKAAEVTSMALDKYVPQLSAIAECQEAIAYWTAREKELKAALGDVMGDAEEGTVGGLPVVRYARVQKFRGGDFAKAYPDLARAYMHERTVKELDVNLIKHGRPDLYAQFQSRPMNVSWEGPKPAPPKGAS